jgi:hypothetical protein
MRYELVFIGNDGSYNMREFEGTLEELQEYRTWLEERGCYGFTAYAFDDLKCEVDVFGYFTVRSA